MQITQNIQPIVVDVRQLCQASATVPLPTGAPVPDNIAQALVRVSACYAAPETAAMRAAAWQNVLSLLLKQEPFSADRLQVKKYLANFMRTIANTNAETLTLETLTAFLQQFSKQEAIVLLAVWLQTNTNTQQSNGGAYDSPEVFFEKRSGDCTEVAWLADQVLSAIGIATDVFVLQYEFFYAMRVSAEGHAFTRCRFAEDGNEYQYVFDNNQLLVVGTERSWKRIVWDTYGAVVWQLRRIDTGHWRSLAGKTDDPLLVHPAETVYATISRDLVVRIFDGLGDLGQYFDNPDEALLFFRDDFVKVITAQQSDGILSPEKAEQLLALRQQYENDGTTLF